VNCSRPWIEFTRHAAGFYSVVIIIKELYVLLLDNININIKSHFTSFVEQMVINFEVMNIAINFM